MNTGLPYLCHQEDYKTVSCMVGKWLLLITYAVFVLSNSSVFREFVQSEAKHLSFLLAASLSIILKPKESLSAMVIGLPIALVYLGGGLLPYAAMVMVFTVSLPLLYSGISSVVYHREKWLIISLVIISLIPALVSLPAMVDDGLFDYTYGRPRMLLGYFHPKEAAIAFVIPMLLLMMYRKSPSIYYCIFLSSFLWMVGSRNIALLFIFAYLLGWHTRLILVFLFAVILLLIPWVLWNSDWFIVLDDLSSLRLSVWRELFILGADLRNMDYESGDRFGADNFFVEAFVISGPIAFLGAILWIPFVGLILKFKNATKWSKIALVLLVFNATFDSGIASTGNIMHVFLWSIMLSSLFENSHSNIKLKSH